MRWSTRSGETAGAVVVAAVLAGAALLADPVGRLLVGTAAAVLVAVAARDLLLRPRVSTDGTGVTVRTLTGRTTIPWPALRVRVRGTRRLGVLSRTLELEDARDDAVLLVLGRRDLGTDPDAVAVALRADGGRPG
ncbi:PH domain-containing protein [Modestobacter sp. URMC 112]